MITWFGTEDNKLEDIIKFSYEIEYIEKEAKIQELMSQEDSPDRGPIGMAINTLSPMLGGDYFKYVSNGTAGVHNLWSKMLGSTIGKYSTARDASEQMNQFRNYDNNKVYEPMNTMREMSMPSGKLKFNHEFTLNFSYKLRAYENINPRSAMMDLIGNILECTSNRGRWWGGQQKIVGPSPNGAAWKKAQHFIDGAWDKIGGLISTIALHGIDGLKDLLGAASNQLKETAGNMIEKGAEIINNPTTAMSSFKQLFEKMGIGIFAKGVINNALGRPAFYAFDSLLTGEPTGLWHVTIGNPRAPIMTIGNLRITNTSFSMGGPLGIDGFPTEIKVAVTLKHCRSRDLSDISKMFANGLSSIYLPTAAKKLSDYYESGNHAKDYSEKDEQTTTQANKPVADSKQAQTNNENAKNDSSTNTDPNKSNDDSDVVNIQKSPAILSMEAEEFAIEPSELLKTPTSFAMWQTNDLVWPALRITIDETA